MDIWVTHNVTRKREPHHDRCSPSSMSFVESITLSDNEFLGVYEVEAGNYVDDVAARLDGDD